MGLELQPMRITMHARARMGVPHGPAAGPGHGARRRLAGAVTLGTPWTINSHHMVHVELQVVEGIAKFRTRDVAAKVVRYGLDGKLEIMTRHAQHIHDVPAQNQMIDDRGGLLLRHAGAIILMKMSVELLGSRALLLRQSPRSIPRC